MNTSITATLSPAVVALCAAYDAWSDGYAASLRGLYGLSRAERNRRAMPPFPTWATQQGIALPPEPLAAFTEPLGFDGNAPILPSLWSESGTTQYIWCLHCEALHGHGVSSGGRAAHCVEPTPYSKTGYILMPVGAMTDAIERSAYAGHRKRRAPAGGKSADAR